ncbi:hypothetical protein MCOR25_006770 [Pyricularia grisea]|uniref:Uncharacterized protein n=1 Tax=Pyricularia grisea TaxID=148305 RepID=A0A6P8B754_PYRGI|nr:hypothetical protein PgNI_06056 [Pyricularia grisea]KAI6360270.1 hypothetical protein MCOR25_006770 [Pyricularia grisea]TLD11078.1 hypothetical protein PgNI_06056 [Pyricularia grisea]
MASTGSPPSLPKPPSRAVQMELQNRISLATSRMSFLQKYRSKRPQPSAAPTNGTATTTKTASFSSLAGKGRPAATAVNNGDGDDDDEDEPPLRAVADPNTGLGHAPKAAAAAATAASRQNDKLRARLVGRQQQQKGGGGSDKSAAKRQRNDQDSSEDDEPGRSGLGRSKKQKRQPTQQQARSDDLEYDAIGDDGGDCTPREEQMQGSRPARAEVGLDHVQHDAAKGLSGPDEIDSNAADPVKGRKNKQKKNKKKQKSSLS